MGKVMYGILSSLGIFMVLAIGAGVPISAMYFIVKNGFDIIAGTLISIISILTAGVLGLLLIIFVFEEGREKLIHELDYSERERLNILRAETRAVLEEMDDMVKLLEDIRNILKEVGE